MDQSNLLHLVSGGLPGPVDPLGATPHAAEPRPDGYSQGRRIVLEVQDEAASQVLLASLPLLDRLLSERTAAVRERQLGELVDFMAERLLTPSAVDVAMAQRIAQRHAGLLNEFSWFTAEQLAQANRSQASQRTALVDNWRKRGQVFAVPHPDKSARERDVYPAFQFGDDHKPLKVVQSVLAAFSAPPGPGKSPWKLALWFTSANGWLPDNARPVDLLASQPAAVVAAAQHDAQAALAA